MANILSRCVLGSHVPSSQLVQVVAVMISSWPAEVVLVRSPGAMAEETDLSPDVSKDQEVVVSTVVLAVEEEPGNLPLLKVPVSPAVMEFPKHSTVRDPAKPLREAETRYPQ